MLTIEMQFDQVANDVRKTLDQGGFNAKAQTQNQISGFSVAQGVPRKLQRISGISFGRAWISDFSNGWSAT